MQTTHARPTSAGAEVPGRERGFQPRFTPALSRPRASSPISLDEMRAAVAAVRGGAFAGRQAQRARSSSDAAVSAFVPRWADAADRTRLVLVLPGHAGAGASTVAVALAEGLAQGRKVQLVDYADPLRSGLVSASSVELGTAGPWRRGRRGDVDVFRLLQQWGSGEEPRLPQEGDPDRWLVVDAGARLTTAWLSSLDAVRERAEQVVVATRLTVPAVRQTEHVLETLGGSVLVAALGPSRWPRLVEASCGPRLRELRARDHVVRMSIDRKLATSGLTGEPLPAAVAAAGQSLATVLAPQSPSQHRRGHQAVSRRGSAETGR